MMLFGKFIDAVGTFAHELSFLAKAVSDDESRYFLRDIYVETSEIGNLKGVATNGRHLHIVDPFDGVAEYAGLIPGYWRVFKDSSHVWIARLEDEETNEWTYPSYHKVIPSGEPLYETTFEGFALSGRHANHIELAKFIHDFPDATAINLKYLMDLGTSSTWQVEWYGTAKAMKLTDGNLMAVIMPMQIV